MKIEQFFIYSLAVWRIANLFVHETGPGKIFQRLRMLAGIQHDGQGIPYAIPDGFFAELLSCVWCSSIWVAFGMTIFWLLSPEWSLKFATIFALSAGAIVISVLVRKNE